jgi:hypothetical protein
MKRGLIAWDRNELPPAVFERRMDEARAALAARDLHALAIYSDIWRANQGRYFTNFMPYWNRSLVVLPREGAPVLLCGLSPRVYPWIRSVTVIEDIRPANQLVPALLTLCEERAWTRLGVLDLARLPYEVCQPLSKSWLKVADMMLPVVDEFDLAMRRRASDLARRILDEHLPRGAGLTDHQFTGRLERALRRAGAEDLIVLISTGEGVPRPARGVRLGASYSVSVALEYRGHWIKLTRAHPRVSPGSDPCGSVTENLAGPYPFEAGAGSVIARQDEFLRDGLRWFEGDTLL